ncbi:MAG: 1-acyl-sn-glycerol-3-phosphate acyltransferase [Acetobacteraceae bacterium]|nr:1-acyl-sn-glycerol-3-phosphate acyltransferase [Acetobacteraceae bacterium]
MRESPRRLRRLAAKPLVPHRGNLPALSLDRPYSGEGRLFVRRCRVIRRAVLIVLWTLPSMAVQAVCLLLPGPPKVAFARLYWAVFTRLLGFSVRTIGEVGTATLADRPVVFVSNHSSWVDIPVLGGVLDGCFVAKGDLARWPVVSTIAKLGRTVFVSRQRGTTARERDTMQARLASGDNLILFPEGTSSDGSRVLPFRSSFFAISDRPSSGPPPLIQPVSVVYDRLDGLPTGRATRPVFAWYGDMDMGSHFWRLSQNCGLRATILLHAPLDPSRFPDRKSLAQTTWQIVANGAATLRQNRPAKPLAPAAGDVSQPASQTALA